RLIGICHPAADDRRGGRVWGWGRIRNRHIEGAGRRAGPRRRRIGRGEGVGAGRQVRRGEAPSAAAGGSGGGGGSGTVTSKALDAALVPADVVSVAVKA